MIGCLSRLAEVLVSTNVSNAVNIHDGRTGLLRNTFNASVPGPGGARVAGALLSEGGKADVIVGSADQGAWAGHDGTGLQLSATTLVSFNTGVWVACSPQQSEINLPCSML